MKGSPQCGVSYAHSVHTNDRLNAEINKIDLNNDPTEIIIIDGDGGDGENGEGTLDPKQLLLPFGIPAECNLCQNCGEMRR